MISSLGNVYLRTTLFIAVGACLIFAIVATIRDSEPNTFIIGLVFATLLQQAVLAAAWAALGPGFLLWRMIFTFAWAAAMGIALEFGLTVFEPNGSEGLLFLAITIILWFVGQIPFWLVWCLTGLRLRDQSSAPLTDALQPMQFGIRELLIITTGIATLLGLGRMFIALGWAPRMVPFNEIGLMALLIGGQLVAGVPLVLAVFLPTRKQVVWGAAIALLMLAATTAAEIPLMRHLSGSTGSLDEDWMFVWTNTLSIAWVLVFAAIVRGSGYHFGVPKPVVASETGESSFTPAESIGSRSPAD